MKFFRCKKLLVTSIAGCLLVLEKLVQVIHITKLQVKRDSDSFGVGYGSDTDSIFE